MGARRYEILYQFLTEAVYMASIGGGLGIVLGVSLPLVAGWIAGIVIPISWISIILASMLSFTVGIISGLIPANRAAKLHPTEALRYE